MAPPLKLLLFLACLIENSKIFGIDAHAPQSEDGNILEGGTCPPPQYIDGPHMLSRLLKFKRLWHRLQLTRFLAFMRISLQNADLFLR